LTDSWWVLTDWAAVTVDRSTGMFMLVSCGIDWTQLEALWLSGLGRGLCYYSTPAQWADLTPQTVF
jgi:hypothetical protein